MEQDVGGKLIPTHHPHGFRDSFSGQSAGGMNHPRLVPVAVPPPAPAETRANFRVLREDPAFEAVRAAASRGAPAAAAAPTPPPGDAGVRSDGPGQPPPIQGLRLVAPSCWARIALPCARLHPLCCFGKLFQPPFSFVQFLF